MKEEDPLHTENLEQAYRVAYLVAGHIQKTLSSREREELDLWLEASEENIALFETLTDEGHVARTLQWYQRLDRQRKEAMLGRLKEKLSFVRTQPKKTVRRLPLLVAAAVFVLLAVGIGLWAGLFTTQAPPAVARQEEGHNRPLDGGQALLLLSDGRRVVLDSSATGLLANEGGTRITGAEGGVDYTLTNEDTSDVPRLHELRIPAGMQYRLRLSDGTLVVLNAASVLRFPARFTGAERAVELSGEGYFEVVHNDAQPFRVKTGAVVIEDLGTRFNVDGYGDEGGIETSLLEGALRVVGYGGAKVLKPGETALVTEKGIRVERGRAGDAAAWTEGEFHFSNTPLPSVLKEIERWYGVRTMNRTRKPMHLNATIQRSVPLAKLLQLLEGQGGVHFTLEGDRVVVTGY
jgi:ferric-dicitrate binding protein FerR (iron transport regulator)